jgi:hypothetical protein
MPNEFSREVKVLDAFDKSAPRFEDKLILSKTIDKFQTDAVDMARQNDVVYVPSPIYAQSYNGIDQTGNFGDTAELVVPATMSHYKSSNFTLDGQEHRDPQRVERRIQAAMMKLASDVNVSILNTISNQAAQTVKVTTAPGDFDDVTLCQTRFDQIGVPEEDRHIGYSPAASAGLNSFFQGDARSYGNYITDESLKNKMLPYMACFWAHKLNYVNRLDAALGGGALTIDTQVGATNYYVPTAITETTPGEFVNTDNRRHTITVSSTTNVVAGDRFTIGGVFEINREAKLSTGALKTFVVLSVDSGTTMTISSPIISAQGGSDAEKQYQNCTVAPAAAAAITFLNTADADMNLFWHRDAVSILPGNIVIPDDAGMGLGSYTTSNGITITLMRQGAIDTTKVKYRLDAFYGTVLLDPDMAGVQLFSQV